MDFDEPEIEEPMKALYRSLRENDRRRHAAIEAAKLGTGGVEYISRLFGCDRRIRMPSSIGSYNPSSQSVSIGS